RGRPGDPSDTARVRSYRRVLVTRSGPSPVQSATASALPLRSPKVIDAQWRGLLAMLRQEQQLAAKPPRATMGQLSQSREDSLSIGIDEALLPTIHVVNVDALEPHAGVAAKTLNVRVEISRHQYRLLEVCRTHIVCDVLVVGRHRQVSKQAAGE